MNTQEKELKHCTACNQMTNHSGETCLKHTSDIEWTDTELYIDLAPEVSHRITAREGVLTNRLQMKAGEIVGLKELLSSHTTYWKERVRKEVEGMKKEHIPADNVWEGDEEQEVGEWKFVPKEDGMYCLNCERFTPEEGCICGLISFEALDTLLDNLK